VRQEGYDRCAGLQLPNHLAWPSLVPLPGLCVNLITLNCVTRSIAQPPDWRTARRLTPPKQPGLISPHALQPNALRVRVTLSEIEPAVWRELVVPWTWHLGQLHLTIQAAFGWWDCHLHEFNIGGLRYGDPVLLEEGAFEDSPRAFDEREVRLLDFDRGFNAAFGYLYDFGDCWRHTLEIEQLLALDVVPKVGACVAGARARPPEDVGGVDGYARFLAIMATGTIRSTPR
jgi:hypothetical protein